MEETPTPQLECVGWKCWLCKRVYALGQECQDCETALEEYEGYGDIASLMVYEDLQKKSKKNER